MAYRVFARNWWKANPSWPNGREPDSQAEKDILAEVDTEDEAREIAKEFNKHNDPGFLSYKAEFEEI